MRNQSIKNLVNLTVNPPSLDNVHSPCDPGRQDKESGVNEVQTSPRFVEPLFQEGYPVVQVGHLPLGLIQISREDLHGFGIGKAHQ